MSAGRRVNHLAGYAHISPGFPRAGFEHIADTELAADVLQSGVTNPFSRVVAEAPQQP